MNITDKIILNETASIKEAIQIIDDNSIKIVLVVEGNKKLIGTITDGDIRRSLLRGISLNQSVKSIMNKNFIYAKVGDSKEKVFQLAKDNLVNQVPILNKDLILMGIEDVINFSPNIIRENTVVLMAGV